MSDKSPTGWFFSILSQSDNIVAIDLKKKDGTIPFHASFRPSEHCIVLNRRTEIGWQKEIRLAFDSTASVNVCVLLLLIDGKIVVQIQECRFVWETIQAEDLTGARGQCTSGSSIVRPIYTLTPSLVADLSAVAAENKPPIGGVVVSRPVVGCVEGAEGCLSIWGWACTPSWELPKLGVETVAGPLDCGIRPVFRSDLFANVKEREFGFEIDLPGAVWRHAADDGTVTLNVTADGRPLFPGAIILRASECLPKLMQICHSQPGSANYAHHAKLALEHLSAPAFQGLMSAGDRRSAFRVAKTLKLETFPPEWKPAESAELDGAVSLGVEYATSQVSDQSPFVSVIICTYNRYTSLPDAINSIDMQDYAIDKFELIIVDNSTNPAEQTAFRDSLALKCRHQYLIERIPGLSRARNIGVQKAQGRIVAFLDDDARASPEWVSRIAEAFAGEKVGIAGGPVRPMWPTNRPSWLHPWLEGYLTIIDRGTEFRTLGENEWLAGTNIAFRRDLIVAAGMFNENLGRIGRLLLSNEELAITTMIRASGFSVIYDPRMEVQHRVHEDRISQSWMRRRVFWQIVSDMFSQTEDGTDFAGNVGHIQEYLAKLSPKERGLGGLFLDVEDPGLFDQQLRALGALVRVIALDGRDWRDYLTGGRA